MEAKELRIGNLVIESNTKTLLMVEGILESNNKEYKISTSTIEGIVGRKGSLPVSALSGIKLAEDWFNKYGIEETNGPINSNDHFRTSETKYYNFKDAWMVIRVNIDSIWLCFDFEFAIKQVCKLEYVHELQNLYFSITGEEL
nr:hypothetical protein [uncultured Draconibacterium sp.]